MRRRAQERHAEGPSERWQAEFREQAGLVAYSDVLVEVLDWIEAGEMEAEDTPDGLLLPWSELVSFAMALWDQEDIERALGDHLATAIPELLRLADLQVRIPRIEILALEHVAAREGKSVGAVLGRELLDFVSVHSEWLSRDIAGFAEALAWPA